MKIGLDFGTCFSQPAIMSGKKPIADNIGEKEGIPSTFAFNGAKNLFGIETRGCKSKDVIRYMKRTVRENPDGIQKEVISGGKKFTVGEVIELYIGYLLDEVKSVAITQDYVINKEFETVTVTAPLGIDRGSMMATDYYSFIRKIVMNKTGLDEDHVFVLSEPEAAALCYLWQDGKIDNESDKTVLVFDLGGGTLDINIMRRRKNRNEFETLVSKGDLYLGGNDWDEKLKEIVVSKEPKCRNLAKNNDLEFETELIDLKLKLSIKEAGSITVSIGGNDDISVTVKREEFERASKDLCDRAMALLKDAIRTYEGAYKEPIDNIILVGGASAMPQIKNGIIAAVPKYKDKIIHDPVKANPSKSIAKGAAIYSSISKEWEKKDDKVTPVLKHTAKQTYGFRSTNSSLNKEMIYNVIFIDTPHNGNRGDRDIVVKAPRPFGAVKKNQEKVTFECFETVVEKKDCLNGEWSELNEKARPNGKKVTISVPKEYYENNRSDEYIVYPELHLDIDGVMDIVLYNKEGVIVGSTKKKRGA